MTWEIGIVLIVVVVMIVSLIKEVGRPDIVVFFSVAVFLFLGILSPAEALSGFSNEGMLTIALLFIVAGVVQQTGILNQIVHKILGKEVNPKLVLLRMMLPVSSLSAFMNNTPIVVMFMADIRNWSKKHNISPSKMLIPLSYASIFGGLITLIGSSTNLIVHGLMLNSGMKGFSMFELSIIGIPAAILGTIYMTTIGYKLLPNRKSIEETLNETSREYLTEIVVETDCSIIGNTIEQAGLRNLSGLYLIEIIRNNERISPISSYEKIYAEDRLIFTGLVATIVELQKIKGLKLGAVNDLKLNQLENGNSQLIEVVVSHDSSLLHKTIKQSNFRSKYDAAVVAVNRNNERIKGKIGDIVLKPGDILLLLIGKEFNKRWSQVDDFYLISPTQMPLDNRKSKIVVFTLIVMVLLAGFNILSIFKSAVVAVFILILTKSVTPEEAKRYIHFNVLLLIGSSFGIGAALQKSGAADLIASTLVHLAQGISIIWLLFMIYFITNIFTEVLSNSATAVIMFPIAVAVANQTGMDPMAFIVDITVAATAGFATPIGYQTNLLVYGPGGYKFSDYMKVGIPLNILYMVLTVFIISVVW